MFQKSPNRIRENFSGGRCLQTSPAPTGGADSLCPPTPNFVPTGLRLHIKLMPYTEKTDNPLKQRYQQGGRIVFILSKQFDLKYKETTGWHLTNAQNEEQISVSKTCKSTKTLLLDCLQTLAIDLLAITITSWQTCRQLVCSKSLFWLSYNWESLALCTRFRIILKTDISFLRIRKNLKPHVSYSNRISPIWMH